MKRFKILECNNLQSISDELYSFLKLKKQIERSDLQFWNFLDKKDLFELTVNCPLTMRWFEIQKLKIREGSFTIWNEKITTSPHVDAPPVVAKINIPVLNTADTYNVWFDTDMKETDRVECVYPIVLRSDVLHTVELGANACLPRIQMSFCFFNEPIHQLMD